VQIANQANREQCTANWASAVTHTEG
jgi:hypothetical protein